jgi:hypothetical protein
MKMARLQFSLPLVPSMCDINMTLNLPPSLCLYFVVCILLSQCFRLRPVLNYHAMVNFCIWPDVLYNPGGLKSNR